MANGRINFGKQSGGVLSLTFPDGATNTEVTLPESGTVATTSNIVGFKNYIINGGFDIWQRGVSFTQEVAYTADMWLTLSSGSTKTITSKSNNESINREFLAPYFMRTVVNSISGADNLVTLRHRLESVSKFASGTFTLSFLIRADKPTKIGFTTTQVFGTGGSGAVGGIASQLVDVNTNWEKKTITFTIPNMFGKVEGANAYTELAFGFDVGSNNSEVFGGMFQQSGTFDIAQVQLEEGSVATPFEHRPYGLELSLCQRYYEVGRYIQQLGIGTTIGVILTGQVFFKTSKRVVPTVTYSDFSGAQNKVTLLNNSGTETNGVSTTAGNQTNNDMRLTASTTNTTQNGISFTYTASAEL